MASSRVSALPGKNDIHPLDEFYFNDASSGAQSRKAAASQFSSVNYNCVYINTTAALEAAVARIGSGITERNNYTETVTLAASNSVVGTGTDWATGQRLRNDDLVRFDGETRYYKVKNVVSDTNFLLYEDYAGTPRTASMNWIDYFIRWTTFVLATGEYNPANMEVFPGQSFVGKDRETVRLVEFDGTLPAVAFDQWGHNHMANLSFAPNEAFDTLDRILGGADVGWRGMESKIENCTFDVRSLGGDHGGGVLQLPAVQGGTSYIENCLIINSESSRFEPCNTDNGNPQGVQNTTVNISNTRFEIRRDWFSNTEVINPSCLHTNVLMTLNLNNCVMTCPEDNMLDVSAQDFCAIRMEAKTFLNLHCCKIDMINTSVGDICNGIIMTSSAVASVVNIFGCDIKVDGTTPAALTCNSGTGAFNIHNSVINSTLTAINAASGTITYDKASTITGTNNGTPEAPGLSTLPNDATPSIKGDDLFLTGGTTTITDFDDGVTGQVIRIVSEHAITITDGTNIFLNGSANYVMAASDTLTLVQKADGLWYELARSNN